MSFGKREGPSIATSSDKRMKSDPFSSFNSEARKSGAPFDDAYDDKEADFLPITNQAIKDIVEGKGTPDGDNMIEQHRKAFMLKAFPGSLRGNQ